jgi:uncharacterized protein YjbI with pentapeptide repeats
MYKGSYFRDTQRVCLIREFTELMLHCQYLGGNAATLLLRNKETFEGANLENTVLCGANLRGSNLLAANVHGCDLRESNLKGSKFDEKIQNALLEDNEVYVRFKITKDIAKILSSGIEELFDDLFKYFSKQKIGFLYGSELSSKYNTITLCIRNCDLCELIESRNIFFEKFQSELEIFFNEDINSIRPNVFIDTKPTL